MKEQKKGQAALEFLSTYAFAFVAISIAIGALYYFGFLDFGKYLPQTCVFPFQFKCVDFGLSSSPSNDVKIKLSNNIGEEIAVTSLIITNDAATPISCTPNSTSPPIRWKPSTEKDFSFVSCTGGAYIPEDRIELKISMQYYAVNSSSKTPHPINGKINGIVKSG